MSNFLFFLITVAVGAVGGLIAYKLKVPAGPMVGSMVFVVAFNLLTERGFFYGDIKVLLQIFAGAMIGCKVGKEDVKELRKIIFPAIILVISMVVLNITFGTLIYAFSSLDVATALFATTPGGVSDMALLCEDLGANSGYVAILQVFRLLIIFTFCPPIFKYLMNKGKVKGAANAGASAAQQPSGKKSSTDFKKLFFLVLSSAIVGLICYFLKVTAGAMIGGMIGGAAFTIWKGKTPFPVPLRIGMQICSGAFIGIRMTRESLMNIDDLIIPILIMIVGILAFVFLTSWIMHKLTKLDHATCMFASTPGGIQEMALLSEDMGADTVKVSVLQTCRLMFVISFFPTMIKMICSIVGN